MPSSRNNGRVWPNAYRKQERGSFRIYQRQIRQPQSFIRNISDETNAGHWIPGRPNMAG
jgi:hypothetical protein